MITLCAFSSPAKLDFRCPYNFSCIHSTLERHYCAFIMMSVIFLNAKNVGGNKTDRIKFLTELARQEHKKLVNK